MIRITTVTHNCRALTQEQLPVRKQQLYETYGPRGPMPLIPDVQPPDVKLALGRSDASASAAQQFVEVVNPNAFAVDVSGWTVSGNIKMTLRAGVVGVGGMESEACVRVGLKLAGNWQGSSALHLSVHGTQRRLGKGG